MTAQGVADLVDPNAQPEAIVTGCLFTEGPAWNPVDRSLVFSDIPADLRRRWTAERGGEEARRPANKCNGMAYDPAGNLVVCEHATSRVVRERADGTVEALAAHYRGRELNSPQRRRHLGDRRHLLHRPDLRAVARLRRPPCSRASLPWRLPGRRGAPRRA